MYFVLVLDSWQADSTTNVTSVGGGLVYVCVNVRIIYTTTVLAHTQQLLL